MTFLKVLSRALKQWLFFWDIYKIPNKGVRLRAVIGFMVFNAMWIWGLIFYYGVYLPYEGYEYPSLSKMNVDNGVWLFSHDGRKLNYVLTTDGKKILFDLHGEIYKSRRKILESQGLNTWSQLDPKIHVKVWWFQRPNTEKNAIGQLEIEGKIVSTYEEQYKSYLESKDHISFYTFSKAFSAFILALLLWELLSQYTKYKQENN